MIHQTSSMSHGEGRLGRAFASAGRSAPQKTANKGYGKYGEQYQHVTPFCAKSHGQAVACSRMCETLLRNNTIMQQGFAC